MHWKDQHIGALCLLQTLEASCTTEGRFVPSREKAGGVHQCTTGQPPGNALQFADMAKQGSVRVANIPPRHTPQTVSIV